ncbi:hypothetical protein RIF29_23910 [Crotalaria pallida]|uniref:C3H1-type domain-containing protein n=1 Tax=Crotalaria pallida TaxID=3830 RepID=A0AAN9HXZ5_CROPI
MQPLFHVLQPFISGCCKNGKGCKFLHNDVTDSIGVVACSPSSRLEGLEQHEEFIKLKAAQNQRLMVMAAISPSSHDKYITPSLTSEPHMSHGMVNFDYKFCRVLITTHLLGLRGATRFLRQKPNTLYNSPFAFTLFLSSISSPPSFSSSEFLLSLSLSLPPNPFQGKLRLLSLFFHFI